MADRLFESHGSARAAGLFFDVQGAVKEWDSAYQRITLFENANFGTVLLLDGMVMTTDLDAPYYHEWLVHPAMTAHPDPKRVLVIGGGDGGTVSEVTRYSAVEEVVMVEIDPEVVQAGRDYFPELSRGFNDSRLELCFEDGAQFVTESPRSFDIIIVDGSDPVGPAKALFSSEFLAACYDRLRPDGIFVTQSESPLYYKETIQQLLADTRKHFDWLGVYAGTVPSYPGALWTWTWGGRGTPPKGPRRSAPEELELYTDGLFPRPESVPKCVQRLLPLPGQSAPQ